MARKKTITRDQILKAAYEVVATEGFTRFYRTQYRSEDEMFNATDLLRI